HGEVEPLEQVVERVPPIGVAPRRWAMLALEWRRLEQSPVEEWDPAQRSCGAAASRRRPIQRAKAQRVQERAMKVPAARDRTVEQVGHVAGVTVQPTLRLDEVEKEQAGKRGECQRVTVEPRPGRAEPLREPIQGVPEGAKEA